MTGLAPHLPRPAEPPHDARFLALGDPNPWEGILADGVDAGRADGTLALAPDPGTAGLGAADGGMGGLAPPQTVAVAPDGRHVLVDRAGGRLLVLEPCRGVFAEAPCLPPRPAFPVGASAGPAGPAAGGPGTGAGAGGRRDGAGAGGRHGHACGAAGGHGGAARAGAGAGTALPRAPRAALIAGERLYVTDAGPDAAVLVFDRRSLVLRALWRPPAQPVPWRPGAMAWSRGVLWVDDPANGRLHRFAGHGGHLGALAGLSPLAALAVDAAGEVWIVRQGSAVAERIDAAGAVLETGARRDALAPRFAEPPVAVLADSSLLLSDRRPEVRVAPDGTRLPPPPPALLAGAFLVAGRLVTRALDSRIEGCVWHRIVVETLLPEGTRLDIACATADAALTDAQLLALPDSAWTPLPRLPARRADALIDAAPGRYLWLRLALAGPGTSTPRIGRIEVEYPRVSLARMLPGAFHQDPVSSSLTTRFVAVMDRPLRDVEARIDHGAALYDADAAPARPGADMLSFVAGWIGLRFEPGWPEARRRRLLRAAGHLMPLRGTAEGLRRALFAYLGWEAAPDGASRRVPLGCHPRCSLPEWPGPALPPLVLEHWRLRRWLFLGAGRLGDAALLWGARILDKAILDSDARLGASRIDSVRDALRDPFHHAAWKASLFLPARLGREAAERRALARFVEEHRPAHVAAPIVWVEPRMRVGIQATIGFDAVIGRWPCGTTRLGELRLGRGNVTPVPARDAPARVGRDAHLGSGARTARARLEGRS